MCWTSPGCRSGWCRRTARNGKPLPVPTQRSMAFRWWERKKKSPEIGAFTEKCRVCTRCFDRQSPQAYSVSTSRLWAQMCGYGAGETGKHRFCGESQLRRCGSTEGSQPFVPGCRGGSALLGSRGNAHWREGSRPIGSRVKRLAQGELMLCVNSYWVIT